MVLAAKNNLRWEFVDPLLKVRSIVHQIYRRALRADLRVIYVVGCQAHSLPYRSTVPWLVTGPLPWTNVTECPLAYCNLIKENEQSIRFQMMQWMTFALHWFVASYIWSTTIRVSFFLIGWYPHARYSKLVHHPSCCRYIDRRTV